MQAQTQSEAMTQSPAPKKNIYISAQQASSTFTLLIYFKNGFTKGCKFHSFKQEKRRWNGHDITDHRYALNRLVMLIENRFKDTYKTAIIYHNPSGTDILTYCYGMIKSKDLFGWETDINGNIDFKFMEKPQNARIHERRQDELQYYV